MKIKEAKDQTSWFLKNFSQYIQKNTTSITCILK